MLDQLLNGVLPVFGIGAVGYFLGLRGTFDFNLAMALNKFVMFVAMPALGFQLLANAPLGEFNLAMLGGYFVTELLMYATGFLIARHIFKSDVMEAALLGLAIALTNHILFVLPISITLFGEAAVTSIVAIISMDGMLLFSGALILMDVLATKDASHGHTFTKIARNPPLVAMTLGLAIGLLGLTVPTGIDVFMRFLGGTASPVLLFALGIILSQKAKRFPPNVTSGHHRCETGGSPSLGLGHLCWRSEPCARDSQSSDDGSCGALRGDGLHAGAKLWRTS